MRYVAVLIAFVASLFATTVSLATGRYALVVGNDSYDHLAPLRNAGNDAQAVAERLRTLGFEVEQLRDARHPVFRKAVSDLAAKRETAELVLLYYAGHGIAFGGTNLLLPSDFDPTSADSINATSVPLTDILFPRGSPADLAAVVVLVDSCSNDPFSGSASQGRGASVILSGIGGISPAAVAIGQDLRSKDMLVFASTLPGDTASDGDGQHSPFTAALLAEMAKSVQLHVTLNRVRKSVIEATGGKQIPWSNMTLTYELSWDR